MSNTIEQIINDDPWNMHIRYIKNDKTVTEKYRKELLTYMDINYANYLYYIKNFENTDGNIDKFFKIALDIEKITGSVYTNEKLTMPTKKRLGLSNKIDLTQSNHMRRVQNIMKLIDAKYFCFVHISSDKHALNKKSFLKFLTIPDPDTLVDYLLKNKKFTQDELLVIYRNLSNDRNKFDLLKELLD